MFFRESGLRCACLYDGPSYLPVYWSFPLAPVWGCLAFVGLVGLGLCPLRFFLRCWLVLRWSVCAFGVVWAPRLPDAMESFVPVHGVLSLWAAAAAAAAVATRSLCAVLGGILIL